VRSRRPARGPVSIREGNEVELFALLGERWRVLAGNLSSSEQQILKMAIVLATSPRLLRLDKPSLVSRRQTNSGGSATLRDISARRHRAGGGAQRGIRARRLRLGDPCWRLAANFSKAPPQKG
jgi:hypothetical protein